ncbi:hypothetical protein EEB11_04900 [Pseudotabrizicola sediminis]|uniref:Uncharacterized protein n=1 Tax=Pseudotabrizicola sediminis TaxID=2486418 RepID=A0ABY2KPM8_9RHOB|nr:hypothetical protein EEB11_04900 [Pseudotabrizicola sediminis]
MARLAKIIVPVLSCDAGRAMHGTKAPCRSDQSRKTHPVQPFLHNFLPDPICMSMKANMKDL